MGMKHGTRGTYLYAVRRGKKYLQGVEPNRFYSSSATAPTMGDRHSLSEYRTVWGDSPAWFERLTAANYLKIIMEEYRWGDMAALDLKIIPSITAG